MIKYYKYIHDGYILQIGTNCGGIEITKEEYDTIMLIIRTCPVAPIGYGYRLTESLDWELFKYPDDIGGDE